MRQFVFAAGVIAALAVGGCSGGGDDHAATTSEAARAATAGARWVISDLGTFGGPESNAVAINGRGQVVGWSDTDRENGSGGHFHHAFLWQNGTVTDLGTLSGRDVSQAIDINDRGQVVGTSSTIDPSGDEVDTHAVLWQDGKATDLGTLGGDESYAVAINERGQVIGESETASGYVHAFLWQKGRMTDLGSLNRKRHGVSCLYGDDDESWATAINERGQIVGVATTDQVVNGCLTSHAFLWEDGKMLDLGTLPGPKSADEPQWSEAADINERGQVVGQGGVSDRSSYAFLWQDGKLSDLGALPGGDEGSALAINDRGHVIGESYDGEWFFDVLWQRGKIIVLGSPPGSFGVRAINEPGQIVGLGSPGISASHALIWDGGRIADLGTLAEDRWDPYVASRALAVNDRQSVVGDSAVEDSECKDSLGEEEPCRRAVVWTLKR